MAIRAILWDVDGTLLDFLAAEKAAVQRLFGEFGLGTCTDGMVARYSAINDAYWKRLERGEIPKQEVLLGRFRDFFSELGIDPGMLAKLTRAMKDGGGGREQALLKAMQPYLSEKRRGKMDRALKLARLARIARLALGDSGDGHDQPL